MCSDPLAAQDARCRIVIVDADRRVRRDLAALVDLGAGYCVVGAAGDGESAIELVRRLRPDVVVLDPRLPDLDAGFAIVSRMRRESGARIVVLGHDPALASRARTVGADAFLTKYAPVSPLLEAIAGRCDGARFPDQPDVRLDG